MHFRTLSIVCCQIRSLLNCYFASAKVRPEETKISCTTLFFRLKCKISPFSNVLNYVETKKSALFYFPKRKLSVDYFSVFENFSLFNLITIG